MFGLAIIAAALTFVGAPSTPVRCNPALDVLGLTYYANPSQPATQIELGQTACAGLILLSASPKERRRIVALNPSANIPFDEGVGAQVLLMETEHASHLYSGDETDDLCRSLAVLPAFLGRYLDGDALTSALRWATAFTAALPPAIYHTHSC